MSGTASNTILLDRTTWDLVLDTSGNIAMASPPYALAQDGSSAIRTFQGECWYDTTLGVPYLSMILGKRPSLQYLKAQFVAAASTVPGVVSVVAYIASIVGRRVTGQVQITDAAGTVSVATFSTAPSPLLTEAQGVLFTEGGSAITI